MLSPWHEKSHTTTQAERTPFATHDYQSGQLEAALEFLKRTRSELRSINYVRVSTKWLQVIDVNGDFFEVRGLGYNDDDVSAVLRAVNTNFKPESIHVPVSGPYKEFRTGRRHPWAEDRVM